MGRRRIGRTSVEVSELGFGAAQIGNLYAAGDDETACPDGRGSLGRRRALLRHRTPLRARAVRSAAWARHWRGYPATSL